MSVDLDEYMNKIRNNMDTAMEAMMLSPSERAIAKLLSERAMLLTMRESLVSSLLVGSDPMKLARTATWCSLKIFEEFEKFETMGVTTDELKAWLLRREADDLDKKAQEKKQVDDPLTRRNSA